MSERDQDELWRELFEQALDQGMDEDSAVYFADEAYELACDNGYPGPR